MKKIDQLIDDLKQSAHDVAVEEDGGIDSRYAKARMAKAETALKQTVQNLVDLVQELDK